MDTEPLWPDLGVAADWTPPARRWRADERQWIAELLRTHRVVLFRAVDRPVRTQLDVTTAIGCPVGVRPRWNGRGLLPQVRIERSDPAPHNDVWHVDGSWSTEPARYTLLYCVAADEDAAATELADTAAGLRDLTEPGRAELRSRQAWHHVATAERLRFGRPADGEPPSAVSGRLRSAWTYRRASWLEAREHGARFAAAAPPDPGAPGALHDVVQHDGAREFVYLGAHAWKLDDESGADSLARIDELTDRVATHRFVHRWQQGDLLVFDNRSLLHRRESGGSGERILRRTLAGLARD